MEFIYLKERKATLISTTENCYLRAHYSISLPSNTAAMQVPFYFRFSCLSDFCVAVISRRNFRPVVMLFHSAFFSWNIVLVTEAGSADIID